MLIVNSLIPFSLLFILQNTQIRCQDDEKENSEEIPLRNISETKNNLDLIHNAYTIGNDLRSEIGSIEVDNFGSDDEVNDPFAQSDYKIRYFSRIKRSTADKERSITSIRKRLNEERRKERDELMSADANPRMEPNETTGVAKQSSGAFEFSKSNINSFPIPTG